MPIRSAAIARVAWTKHVCSESFVSASAPSGGAWFVRSAAKPGTSIGVGFRYAPRVEAFFFVEFLALLVRGLIERELRRAMERDGVSDLPLYPEERRTRRPTSEQVLRLFAHVARHVLTVDGDDVHAFEPQLTPLQSRVLALLGVPEAAFRPKT